MKAGGPPLGQGGHATARRSARCRRTCPRLQARNRAIRPPTPRRPFAWDVWVAIGITLALFPLLLWLTDSYIHKGRFRDYPGAAQAGAQLVSWGGPRGAAALPAPRRLPSVGSWVAAGSGQRAGHVPRSGQPGVSTCG